MNTDRAPEGDDDKAEPEDSSSRNERGNLETPFPGGGGGGGGGLSAADIGEALVRGAEMMAAESKQEREERLRKSNEEWERNLKTRID